MRRFRRLRAGEQIRSLVRETRIDKGDLIYPIFIAEGENIKKPVDSMPNVYQYHLTEQTRFLKKLKTAALQDFLFSEFQSIKTSLQHQPMTITV